MLALAVAPVLVACAQGGRPALARWAGGVVALVAAVCAVLVVLARGNVPADIARAGLPYLGLCAATAMLMAWAARRASGRLVVGGILGCMLAALLLSGWSLAALTPWTPVPRFAERIVAEARPGDAAVVYATSVKSLNFYARRRVVDARNPAALLAAVPPRGRAYVVADGRLLDEVRAQPSLSVEELERRPYFEFHFRRNVLGQGPSTRDYLLLRVERRDPAETRDDPPPGREAPGGGPRSGPDR
jgi:hypothetical protein